MAVFLLVCKEDEERQDNFPVTRMISFLLHETEAELRSSVITMISSK